MYARTNRQRVRTRGAGGWSLPSPILNLTGASLDALAVDAELATWADESGNGYDATQTTPTERALIKEYSGTKYAKPDGVDDYMDIPVGVWTDMSAANEFTLGARVRFDGVNTYASTAALGCTRSSGRYVYAISFNNSSGNYVPRTLLGTTGGVPDAYVNAEAPQPWSYPPAEAFATFVCRMKSGSSTAYIDGVAGVENTNTYTSFNNDVPHGMCVFAQLGTSTPAHFCKLEIRSIAISGQWLDGADLTNFKEMLDNA